MRWLPSVLLLLTACSPEATQPPAERLLYSGAGRDRLCIAGQRGGLIIYGKDDANCSVRGQVSRTGEQALVLTPAGDADCRIDLIEQAGGGVVEGYPHDTSDGRKVSVLYDGTRRVFEEAGFTYVRPKGLRNCVMRARV